MLRNTKTKVLLSLFLIITLISTLSFAENETTNETQTPAETTTTTNETSNETNSVDTTSTTDENGAAVITEENSGEAQNSSKTNSQDVHEGEFIFIRRRCYYGQISYG